MNVFNSIVDYKEKYKENGLPIDFLKIISLPNNQIFSKLYSKYKFDFRLSEDLYLDTIQNMKNINIPFCYLEFFYSYGNPENHIVCAELCEDGDKKKFVDEKTSIIIRRFSKMFDVNTYCFKSQETDTICINNMRLVHYEKELMKNNFIFHGTDKPVYKKVDPTTEYIIVDFISIPYEGNRGGIGSTYGAAVCIKVDSDIGDRRIYTCER